MKPGLCVGVSATVEDTVGAHMQAAFGGEVVHAVYGTAAMVYHMEWAARRVIVPYLEPHEEGIGMGVEVRHLHPAPIGAVVVARAKCVAIEGEHIICDVEVHHDDQLLGEGTVKQRILPKAALHARFPELWGSETLS